VLSPDNTNRPYPSFVNPYPAPPSEIVPLINTRVLGATPIPVRAGVAMFNVRFPVNVTPPVNVNPPTPPVRTASPNVTFPANTNGFVSNRALTLSIGVNPVP
jgi:hypothetical protein